MSKKIKTLVVDDDPSIRKSLRIMLSTISGLEIVGEAECGESALKFFSATDPELILLDVNLPKISGIDVLKKLKEINPNLYVIMITGTNDAAVVKECILAGAKNYILKNNDPNAIRETVKNAVHECMLIRSEQAEKIAIQTPR